MEVFTGAPKSQEIRNEIFDIHIYTVPLDLNFTYARTQKATARNIHGNAPE